MAAVTSRFPHPIDENDAARVACISKMMQGSEINVFSDGYIQEIKLNIFPPTVAYNTATNGGGGVDNSKTMTTMTRCKYCGNGCQHNDEANCLSIDVIQEVNKVNSSDDESQKKALQGNFSHIALKRSDSILHIAIGNSSKIMKRRKRRRLWFFAKLYKLSRSGGKKSPTKECYSPEVSKEGKIFHLNNMNSLSVINDDIVISINKKSRQHAANQHHHQQHQQMPSSEIYQNQFRSILGDNLAHGANELDLYMNEIKMREMG